MSQGHIVARTLRRLDRSTILIDLSEASPSVISEVHGLDRTFAVGGHGELENGPARQIGAGPQSAAMRLNDRTADRQADAQTIGLGGEERVEQALHPAFR